MKGWGILEEWAVSRPEEGRRTPFSDARRLFLSQKQLKRQKLAPRSKTAESAVKQRQYRIIAGDSGDVVTCLQDPIEAKLTFKAINWCDLGK